VRYDPRDRKIMKGTLREIAFIYIAIMKASIIIIDEPTAKK
jgi:energy-coupling factor transporter ATP-binding protein EcfA2